MGKHYRDETEERQELIQEEIQEIKATGRRARRLAEEQAEALAAAETETLAATGAEVSEAEAPVTKAAEPADALEIEPEAPAAADLPEIAESDEPEAVVDTEPENLAESIEAEPEAQAEAAVSTGFEDLSDIQGMPEDAEAEFDEDPELQETEAYEDPELQELGLTDASFINFEESRAETPEDTPEEQAEFPEDLAAIQSESAEASDEPEPLGDSEEAEETKDSEDDFLRKYMEIFAQEPLGRSAKAQADTKPASRVRIPAEDPVDASMLEFEKLLSEFRTEAPEEAQADGLQNASARGLSGLQDQDVLAAFAGRTIVEKEERFPEKAPEESGKAQKSLFKRPAKTSAKTPAKASDKASVKPEAEKPAKSAAKSSVQSETKVSVSGAKAAASLGLGRVIVHFLAFYIAILFWELFIYREIHGGLQGFTIWTALFALAEAMVCAFITGWIKNRVANRIGSVFVMAVVWLFYVSQLIYFRIFGSMFSVSMIGVGGDAMDDFGWALRSTLKESVGVIIISLIPLILFAFAVFFFRTHIRYRLPAHVIALLSAVIIWALVVVLLPLGGKDDSTAYFAYHSKFVDTDTASTKIGILANSGIEASSMIFGGGAEQPEEDDDIIIHTADDLDDTDPMGLDTSPNILKAINFTELATKTKNKDMKSLCTYFAAEKGTKRNEYTGMFEGYNLIYICAESFSTLALDENATPVLWKLAHEGIVLNNFYNSFKNTTTNGEYAFLCSLWPDVSRKANMGSASGSFVQTADNLMPFGMGTMFNEQCGTKSRGYHNFKGSYYSRNKTLPNLGFECKFMNAGMKFTSAWPASDLEMMEQSIPDYINDNQFCVYYMTFSGHGPYNSDNVMYNRNINTVKKLLGNRKLTSGAQGYIACNYELEKAMAYLLDELEKAGKLENTVIVLTGDHYPYYVGASDRNSLAGHTVETNFEMYKSTCIMWNGGLKEPIVVDDYCCNVDIFPTILNLFGLEYDSRMMAGRDIFADTEHFAMLYNKSFITDKVKYNGSTGKATWAEGVTMSDAEKKAYLETYNNLVKNRYSMSLKIESTDFYKFVWKNTTF